MGFVLYEIWCNSVYLFIFVTGYRYLGDDYTDRRESLRDGRSIIRTEILHFGAISLGVTKKGEGVDFGPIKSPLTANISERYMSPKCTISI